MTLNQAVSRLHLLNTSKPDSSLTNPAPREAVPRPTTPPLRKLRRGFVPSQTLPPLARSARRNSPARLSAAGSARVMYQPSGSLWLATWPKPARPGAAPHSAVLSRLYIFPRLPAPCLPGQPGSGPAGRQDHPRRPLRERLRASTPRRSQSTAPRRATGPARLRGLPCARGWSWLAAVPCRSGFIQPAQPGCCAALRYLCPPPLVCSFTISHSTGPASPRHAVGSSGPLQVRAASARSASAPCPGPGRRPQATATRDGPARPGLELPNPRCQSVPLGLVELDACVPPKPSRPAAPNSGAPSLLPSSLSVARGRAIPKSSAKPRSPILIGGRCVRDHEPDSAVRQFRLI